MTDFEFLLMLLAGFYLGECMFWARAGMMVFAAQWGRRHRRYGLGYAILRNPDGGVLLGNLFPFGHAALCQQWPLSLSPIGVYAYVAPVLGRDDRPRYPERFVCYEDIARVETNGGKVLINGVLFARAGSHLFALELANTIRTVAKLPQSDRAAALDRALAAHLDSQAVAQRLRQLGEAGAELRLTCLVLFFLVFLYTPLVLLLNPPAPFFPLLGAYFGLASLAFLQFRHAHQTLFPAAHWERWKDSLMLLISPADAAHAHDKLARALLCSYHPLAASQVLEPPKQFAEFAAEIWRDLEHPMLPVCPVDEDGPLETEAWFRQRWKALVKQFLIRHGLDPAGFMTPPRSEAYDSRSYCPRCRSQYVMVQGTCESCGGRPLVAL
ncbi:MAG: hypothetical protein L0215_03865 [Gemmataceae bacterium]|nr:hypothetical protein [Gemmataceae bacterium]